MGFLLNRLRVHREMNRFVDLFSKRTVTAVSLNEVDHLVL
jgi:hypothetical protein